MERRRQPRTPVNINALLIGEKTVPKGCRVINVSQQGMLLYCEADGRLSTFNDGDTVDIHLTVIHAGEQKKLTIPAVVRHVAENSVDVEFLNPDPILTETIESYRVSDKHRLEATFGQNHSSGVTPLLSPQTATRTAHSDDGEEQPLRGAGHRPFYLGMLVLLLILCIVTGGYIYTASIDSRLGTLETLSDHQSGELSDLRNRVVSSDLQESRYTSLNSRIAALTTAFSRLEQRVITGTAAEQAGAGMGQAADLAPQAGEASVVITPFPAPSTTPASEPAAANRTDGEDDVTAGQASFPAARASRGAPAGPFMPAQQSPQPAARTAATASTGTQPDPEQPLAEGAAPPEATQIPEASIPPQVTDASATTAASAVMTRPANTDAEPAPVKPAPVATIAPTEPAPVATITAAELPATSEPLIGQTQARTGPWRINLLSSPARSDITRLAEKAAQLEIATHIEQASIKGQTWWRLQVTGFDSMAEASKAAEPLKQRLGINEVWVLKQR